MGYGLLSELETDAPYLCLYLIHRLPIFSFVIPSTGVAFISDNIQRIMHAELLTASTKYCILIFMCEQLWRMDHWNR